MEVVRRLIRLAKNRSVVPNVIPLVKEVSLA